MQALQGADVIFYDELVGADILDRARRDAEQVFVGKRKGEPGIGQDEINRLLVDAARPDKLSFASKAAILSSSDAAAKSSNFCSKAGIPRRRARHHGGARMRGGSRACR